MAGQPSSSATLFAATAGFLVVACLLDVTRVSGVQITHLHVPGVIRNGSGTPAVLDCEYTLRPEELATDAGLVVKWFFNNGPAPVYQWIPGQKPQDLGILRGRLRLGHRASDNNATMHRALYIPNPTTELSGEYKCCVSTFGDEDFMTKKMIVFAPERNLELTQSHAGHDLDSINITCRAQGVYPEPEMQLYKTLDDTKMIPVEDVSVVKVKRGSLYDVVATKVMSTEELLSPTAFDCEFRIPDVNYVVRKSIIYYTGILTSSSDSGGFQLATSALCCSLASILAWISRTLQHC